MTCPVCGTVAVPGARFCHNCGAALPAAATLPAAERRIVRIDEEGEVLSARRSPKRATMVEVFDKLVTFP